MVTLNDYLYSGNTVLKILNEYTSDLMQNAKATHNSVDIAHCNILIQLKEILIHNDFLSSQSNRIKELYKYMTREYPFLAFTFKGRIKSLIRAEEKVNGYIMEYILNYYTKNGKFPKESEIKTRLSCFRDIIAYRIVIQLPKCHANPMEDITQQELKYLYEIANILPTFLEERGFSAELSGFDSQTFSELMDEANRPLYRDYIVSSKPHGYQSLHITLYDNFSRCYTEVQLRTKDMDDNAEIGEANHFGYEKQQELERQRAELIPKGECLYYDEAYERCSLLQTIDLSKIDVNMFRAIDNYRVNDGCGLFRGRQILPFEHLSRFQNDLID
ncbi:MAG: guanosine polyphosphate pyrophosphohydrolase [Oscillospiraceae bacterium]|nr:guanosine polyphosphate pyrophosphohydrolase [Oscillospiraceae bacterium]